MGDTEFSAKLAKIQQSRASVATAADAATATPGPSSRLVAERQPGSPPDAPSQSAGVGLEGAHRTLGLVKRRRTRPRVSAFNLFGKACFALAALAALSLLVTTPLALGPALRAARGLGTPGAFIAQNQQCTRSGCIWTGTFRSDYGTVLPDADYGDTAPADTHRGSSLPALWPGGSHDVYAAHGSTAWIQFVLADFFSVVLLAAFVWYGPIRYLRKRTRHKRARSVVARASRGTSS